MKKFLIFIIVLSLLLLPASFCADEEGSEEEFLPSEFVFCYNDHNTTVYEGDSGLKVALVNNTLSGKEFYVPTEYVRGIAYVTQGTFKFDEAIIITLGPLREWDNMYVLTKMRLKNGTIIPYLGIEKNDLTSQQKKYFDNYEAQRSDYLLQQQEYASEDLYDYQTIRDSNRPRYSYYFGSGGSGVIYTPSGRSYW